MPRDVATLRTDSAVELGGPAGTVVLLDCRVVHGSAVNHSPRMRPLLLNVYASADTLPISPAPEVKWMKLPDCCSRNMGVAAFDTLKVPCR